MFAYDIVAIYFLKEKKRTREKICLIEFFDAAILYKEFER
jgi:hypothetical protein